MKITNYIMDLPVRLTSNSNYRWTVNLPHCFLNHLLELNHRFDSGILCLELTTPYGSRYYCCMNEFTRNSDTIDIPQHLNRYLNIVDDMYIHVERTVLAKPFQIIVQGHREAFTNIDNLKEKLETLFSEIKIVNSNMVLDVEEEIFDIITISDKDMNIMTAGLIVESELEIVFLQTLEAIEIEKEQRTILREIEAQKEAAIALAQAAEEEKKRLEEIERLQGRTLGGDQPTRPLTREERAARLEKIIGKGK